MVKKSHRDASSQGDSKDSSEKIEWTWASTFDLIESEYNWTDEIILELTLERINQILDKILDRKTDEEKLHARKFKFLAKCIEVSTKLTCKYIVETCPYIEAVNKQQIIQEIDKFKLVDDEDIMQESQVDEKVIYNKAEDLMNLHF